jgi:hypothetical protein
VPSGRGGDGRGLRYLLAGLLPEPGQAPVQEPLELALRPGGVLREALQRAHHVGGDPDPRQVRVGRGVQVIAQGAPAVAPPRSTSSALMRSCRGVVW